MAAVPPQRHTLLQKRLERLTRALPAVGKGDVDALHQARVASRRLRELLPILQLDHATAYRLSRRLRKVTERLGAVRELDVLLSLIHELRGSRRQDEAALARVAEDVEPERADAREKLLARKLPVASLRQLVRKLDRVGEALEGLDRQPAGDAASTRGWRWALDARVAHRTASLREALSDAGAVYLPDRLHRVRIAVKKLRYALELSAEVKGVTNTPDLRTLKRTQKLLGRLHDLETLLSRVRQVQASLDTPDIDASRQLDALVRGLEDGCRRLHARYMRDRGALEAVAREVGARVARITSQPGRRRAAG